MTTTQEDEDEEEEDGDGDGMGVEEEAASQILGSLHKHSTPAQSLLQVYGTSGKSLKSL